MTEVKTPIYRDITSMQLRRGTKKRLAKLGEKGESYETILIRLMDIRSPKKG